MEAFSPPRSASSAAKLAAAYSAVVSICVAYSIPCTPVYRKDVLEVLGIESGLKKAALKKAIIAEVKRRWPDVELPNALADAEHPADAAAAGFTAMSLEIYQARWARWDRFDESLAIMSLRID